MPIDPPSDDSLGDVLAQHLEHRQDIADLRRAAEALKAAPAHLHRHLVGLCRAHSRLEDLAERSTVHPNGFVKIPLIVRDQWGVRVHMWHPDHPPAGQIMDVAHSHRWPFASWVMVGGLIETEFVESDTGEPVDRYGYGRRRDGTTYQRGDGGGSVRPSRRIPRPAGAVYTRQRAELHAVNAVGDGLAASLVVQGERMIEPAAVFRRPGAPPPDERPLSSSALRNLLDEMVDALAPAR